MRLIKAFCALVVLLAVVLGPPLALAGLIGNPWPAEGVSLSAPLTDGALIGLLAVIVWVLWAQLVGCIVVETIAALSGDRIQIRTGFALGIQHHVARQLVTAVVLAVVPAGVVLSGGGDAVQAALISDVTGLRPVATIGANDASEHGIVEQRSGGAAQGVDRRVEAHSQTVPVVRLDTLWGIADRILGDGNRWPEIAALNEGHVMNDGAVFTSADQIQPGWELQVPATANLAGAPGPAPTHRVVASGDTLSGIAQETTGDPANWKALFEANKGTVGSNPDLIYPGQRLRLPGAGIVDPATDSAPHPQPGLQGDHSTGNHSDAQPGKPGPDGVDAVGQDQQTPEVVGAPEPTQTDTDQRTSSEPAQRSADAPGATDTDEEGEMTALRALLASAMCLSAGALGLVAANRRRQFRRRRIGRTIAATPDALVSVEQAILENGSNAQDGVVFLDRALRHAAASCHVTGTPLPQLGAAVLGDEDLTLLFTQPATSELPQGWAATADARAWMLPRSTFLEQDLQTQPAPYPALVSIGQDDGGRTWLLDLETLGACGIGGEQQQVADLARFMVAELAVNIWSEGSEVLLVDGFCAETVGLNPARLRQVNLSDAMARTEVLTTEMDEAEQNSGADLLTRRRDGLVLDTANSVVAVVAARAECEFAAHLAHLADRERSRVVVVHGVEESPAVELSSDGMAFLPMWGISVRAFTLPLEDAEAMSALLVSTRNVADQPMPAPESDDGPLGKYALVDGSLRVEYTEPRRTEGNDPSSLLPDADESYLAAAATTVEDLAVTAPSVPEETRAEIEAIDPTLEQDLADWFDESSVRPKVRLLGPVNVTARGGGDPTALNNLAGTISFVAYLACQDRGVTGERAAEACGWKTQKTVQNRATNARFLLGTRPDGSDWLPDATASDGARRGTPTYGLVGGKDGVLVDFDLFKRLHFRAQKRGHEGCDQDLVTALSLVDGAPFEAGTDRRFPWLFKGQRHDDIMVAAVHKVAHVLATRALAEGHPDLVRLACAAARKASPHSDVAWLDQAAAAEAEAGRAAADKLVREHVVDIFDEDLPPRTEAVLDQRDWATG